MKIFRKVAIVGLGLIGGSLALECKKNKLAKCIIGISRRKTTLAKARSLGIFNKVSADIRQVKDADFVIFATPVETTILLARRIRGLVSKDVIVTDVGSTKAKIVANLEKSFPYFLGSHPLAGSEKSGIENARSGLFKNSIWLVTPTKNTRRAALNKVTLLARRLGARVAVISPSRHDKILSFTSHLVHAAAFGLMATVPQNFLPWSAGGLKDATRIAASDAQLWADIFLTNKKNMRGAILALQENLSRIKIAIAKNDRNSLIKILTQAKAKRARLDTKE